MRDASLVLLGVVLACARQEPPAARTPEQPVAWAFDAPATWDERVTLLDDTTPGRHLSARFFTYKPSDTTVRPQALLGIVVYDSAAWAGLRAEAGPPPGDSLLTLRGKVFVAALPQSNPFAPASADRRSFDSLAVDLSVVRKAFRVLQE
jgi:hypothetical protein